MFWRLVKLVRGEGGRREQDPFNPHIHTCQHQTVKFANCVAEIKCFVKLTYRMAERWKKYCMHPCFDQLNKHTVIKTVKPLYDKAVHRKSSVHSNCRYYWIEISCITVLSTFWGDALTALQQRFPNWGSCMLRIFRDAGSSIMWYYLYVCSWNKVHIPYLCVYHHIY